ncbi:MAG: molybdenum cofactor guanylyltransferase [Halanaeroarchaeum sp.]
MSEEIHRSGIVVCGGESERFGDREKAFVELEGEPLVRHVTDGVATVVDEVVLNCHPRHRERFDRVCDGERVTIAEDDRPGEGPLPGIRRGLTEAGGEYAVVVACDMPFVDPGFLAFLFERAGQVEAAIPRVRDGWYQPLQAVYAVDPFVAAIDDALAAGVDRPIEPALELDHVVVWNSTAVASEATFFNVNTPDELSEAAERI